MIIIREGKEIQLTSDEIFLAHKEFVTDWMAEVLQTDFGFNIEDSKEIAQVAYEKYCDEEGLTEYEAVQKAAEENK